MIKRGIIRITSYNVCYTKLLRFEAVLARRPVRPVDFDQRMRAVKAFRNLPESESLASANKRIRNILRKSGSEIPAAYDSGLLQEGAEQDLARAMRDLDGKVTPLFERNNFV